MDFETPPETPPRQEGPGTRAFLARAAGGGLLGAGLCLLILVLAGAPPFDFAAAQAPGAVPSPLAPPGGTAATATPAAETITGDGRYGLPTPASEHAPRVYFLFNLINVIVGIVFVGVEALLVYFAIRYRHRPGQKALFTHGNHRLEMAWTITPAVILAVLVFLSASTWSQIRFGDPPPSATEIEVTGQQFQWNFKTLGTAERFGKAEDLKTQALIHVPFGKPVAFQVKSRDVLHGFAVPNCQVHIDAVPGMTGRVWFTPTRLGSFEVVCKELCGAEHFKMRGVLTVDSPADYEKWLEEIKIYTPDKPR